MELRLLNEADVPALARVMNVSFTNFHAEPEALRVWFRGMDYTPLGIFDGDRLVAFAICLWEGQALRAKDLGTYHEYRTPEYIRQLMGMFQDWARAQGAERLLVETCAANLRVVELYRQSGLELKKHLPNRVGTEHGLEMEVDLGR
jgi:GNAT superfamily N-acetyltransferase